MSDSTININEVPKEPVKFLDHIFSERKFTRKSKNGNLDENAVLTEEELFKEVKHHKIVLFSDSCGTGKTWFMKNVANYLRNRKPIHWVNHLVLKRCSKIFKEARETDLKFEEFIGNKILKVRNFEREIFKQMYKIGKVDLIFDGFDQVTPDNFDFVIKLCNSFKHNDTNQLWIVTRNHHEAKLQETLKIDTVYKFVPFTEEQGMRLIQSYFLFYDLEENYKFPQDTNFDEFLKNYTNYPSYYQQSKDFIDKVHRVNCIPIEYPMFYELAASIYLDYDDPISDTTVYQIFKEISRIYFDMWADVRTEYRKIDVFGFIAELKMTFHELHEFYALNSYYVNKSVFCHRKLNRTKWSDERILSCGLLTKRNNTFFFLYDAFRDFYVADFVINGFMRGNEYINKEFCKYIMDFLTKPRFRVVRLFLDSAFGDKSVLRIIKHHLPTVANLFHNHANIRKQWIQVFNENNKNIQDFIVDILKSGSYDKVQNIIAKYIEKYGDDKWIREINFSLKLLDFIINFFSSSDVKKFMLHKTKSDEIFIHLLFSTLDSDIVDHIMSALQRKLCDKDYKMIIDSKSTNVIGLECNLLETAAWGSQSSTYKILWKHFRNYYVKHDQFMTFLKGTDDTVISLALQTSTLDILEFIMSELEENASKEQIKEIMSCLDYEDKNILQTAALTSSIEIYKFLWTKFTIYFEKSEIFDLLTHFDVEDNNLFQIAVRYAKLEIVEHTWKEIKKIIENKDDQSDYLSQKDRKERSLKDLVMKNSEAIVQNWVDDLLKEYEVVMD